MSVPARGGRVRGPEPERPARRGRAGGHDDGHRAYALPGLADGTYSVGLLPDPDWKATAARDEFTEVTIAGGSAVQADFGRTRRLIGDVGPQTVRVGGTLDVTVPLTAAAAGHRLVYSLDGTVPAGMTIDSATGELRWSPTAADAGRHTATVRVSDPFDTRGDRHPAGDDRGDDPESFRRWCRPWFRRLFRRWSPGDPPPVPQIAVGGAGEVRVFAADGAPRLTLRPFGAGSAAPSGSPPGT